MAPKKALMKFTKSSTVSNRSEEADTNTDVRQRLEQETFQACVSGRWLSKSRSRRYVGKLPVELPISLRTDTMVGGDPACPSLLRACVSRKMICKMIQVGVVLKHQ